MYLSKTYEQLTKKTLRKIPAADIELSKTKCSVTTITLTVVARPVAHVYTLPQNSFRVKLTITLVQYSLMDSP